ncbi:MAG: hypothetical protein OHK0017_13610 [Patescibacteria group bacterium]
MGFLDWHALKHNRRIWKDSFSDLDSFWSKFGEEFEHIDLGASFIPEVYGFSPEGRNRALEVLRFMLDEMKIRHVRLGLRWSSIEPIQGQFSLGYYQPFLDLMQQFEVEICLGVGAVKTCGWPEEHLPDWIKQIVVLPPKGSLIKHDNLIAQMGRLYQSSLLDKLHKLKVNGLNITQLQPENEAFNPFGNHRWTFTNDYLLQQILLIRNYFPEIQILLNSNGRFDLRKIIDLTASLEKLPNCKSKDVVIGYDYYYTDQWRRYLPGHKLIDSASLSLPGNPDLKRLWELSSQFGYQVEVTEAQAEPWLDLISPGNSAQEFQFLLRRCTNSILKNKSGLIRLWGIWQLAEKFLDQKQNQEHEQILQLITKVNT